MVKKDETQAIVLEHVFANSPFGIIYFNDSGIILNCNDYLVGMLNMSREQVIGKKLNHLFTTLSDHLLQEILSGKRNQYELQVEHSPSNILMLQCHSTPVLSKEKGVIGGILFVQDITAYKLLQSEMKQLTDYDRLTGLPNRQLFVEHFRTLLTKANQEEKKVALLIVDIDRFKAINDLLGFDAGDQILNKVAVLLSNLTSPQVSLAKIGGDSFAILVDDIKTMDEVETLANQVLALFKEPICLEQQRLQITISMGVSLYPDDGEEVSMLIKHADLALAQAKKSGRNTYKLYTESIGRLSFNRLHLERDLRKALINNQFKLYYQPQIKFSTKEIIGIEALLRWEHHGEMIPPQHFIPIAEETGLIHSIGEWVLREACQQNKRWQDEGLLRVPIAVNISIAQIEQQNFVDQVRQILEITGMEPHYLQLELTESMLIQNMDTLVSIIQSLKQLGVQIVLDDFGTGYSSFSYLRHLYIDSLKIDRSFVKNIPVHPQDGLISSAIINLAKSLDIQVVAEGVETEEQVQFLMNHSCDQMQGFFFSRPLHADQLREYLRLESR